MLENVSVWGQEKEATKEMQTDREVRETEPRKMFLGDRTNKKWSTVLFWLEWLMERKRREKQ